MPKATVASRNWRNIEISLSGLGHNFGGNMRPGLEEWFKEGSAVLSDRNIRYGVRMLQWKRLIQAQEGVVRIQSDGSIATPVDPDDTKDAIEYLERLKQIKVPVVTENSIRVENAEV